MSTASEQLERILYILPAAHRPGGVLLDDLARALGVDRQTVLADIEEVTAREYYHPAGSTNAMSIAIERDRVRVTTAGEFDRPVRLSDREALAVQLGLRTLAAESEASRRRVLLALARRLEAELVAPEADTVQVLRERTQVREARAEGLRAPAATTGHDLEYDLEEEQALLLGLGDDTLRGVLSDAIVAGRTVALLYLKPGTHAPELRRIAPVQLAYAEGRWYVLAHDLARRAPRIFRLDRALDARAEEDPIPAAARDRAWIERVAEAGPAPYFAPGDVPATVRYSRAVARWVAEQSGVAPGPDGSVLVEHRVADPNWLVRHVLQFAGEACVEGPPELRRHVAARAAHVATAAAPEDAG